MLILMVPIIMSGIHMFRWSMRTGIVTQKKILILVILMICIMLLGKTRLVILNQIRCPAEEPIHAGGVVLIQGWN
ncbi:hypothetical protein NX85_10155 [Aeromonas salmonicida subsp. salmonicida]|nr:hypothetical protein BHG40_16710 [Aeromonas salmonicida subsp. masoucida]KHF01102.1 hypothetical protein NX85_10155 [Aeromonas salmonicida subsp. salmonicida]OKA73263.1 hypothetical protein BHR42_23080 [Aeromonas salmonicida subsp. salmonicida]